MIDRIDQRVMNGLAAQISSVSSKAGAGIDFNRILQDSLSSQGGEKPLELAAIKLLYRTLEAILSESETGESYLPPSSSLAFSSLNWPTVEMTVLPPGRQEIKGTPERTDQDAGRTVHDIRRMAQDAGIVLGTGPVAQGTGRVAWESQDFEGIIRESARKYSLDPALIKAIIAVESGGDPKAVSPAGAQGLMQLMPGTAADLGVADPFDPVQNIMGGSRYLRQLLDRYQGNVRLALAAYNWGMGNLESRPNALPKETRNYIIRVEKYCRA